jgi:hypothetical protein
VIVFEIAKATEARLTDKTLFTAFEQFIGTAYMSPEQAEMSGHDVARAVTSTASAAEFLPRARVKPAERDLALRL